MLVNCTLYHACDIVVVNLPLDLCGLFYQESIMTPSIASCLSTMHHTYLRHQQVYRFYWVGELLMGFQDIAFAIAIATEP